MKYGARNAIVGKVGKVKKGSLMCQVEVEVKDPVVLSSVMTLDSLKGLGIRKGDKVRVIVKAVNVLLVKE